MDDEKKQNNVESSIRGSILRSKINKKKNVTPKIMKGAAFMGGAFALGGSISHVYKAFANEDLKDQQNQNETANVDTMLEKYAESYANQTPSESWSEVLSVSDVNSDDLKTQDSEMESASFAANEDSYMYSLQSSLLEQVGDSYMVSEAISMSWANIAPYYGSLIEWSQTSVISSNQLSEMRSIEDRSNLNIENISNNLWDPNDTMESMYSKFDYYSDTYDSIIPDYESNSTSDSISFGLAESYSKSTSESISTSESESKTESESDTTSESRSASASQSASASRSFSRFMSAIGSISRHESRSESASASHSVSDSISTSETSESHTSSESSSGSESISESISTSQSSSETEKVPQTGDETNAALILGAAALGAAGIAGNSAKKKNDK